MARRHPGRSGWAGPPGGAARFAQAKPLGALGGFFVALMIFLALFADIVAPYDYNKRNLRDRLEPPSLSHLMGTDNMGRDIFSRIVYGARVSISVGFGGVGIGALIATLVGITSGYFGGPLRHLVSARGGRLAGVSVARHFAQFDGRLAARHLDLDLRHRHFVRRLGVAHCAQRHPGY